jgi:hypothetical protein
LGSLRSASEGQCRTEPRGGLLALMYVVWFLMNIGSAALAGMVSLMVLGCAATQPESPREARLWRERLESQQAAVREDGRIGYIGYDGSAGE